jgi:hypothetical protein
LVQAFLKKWWVESDFKAPNLPLSLRLKVSGCHIYFSGNIYKKTISKCFELKLFCLSTNTLWVAVACSKAATEPRVPGEVEVK